jgi:hypothetical protein
MLRAEVIVGLQHQVTPVYSELEILEIPKGRGEDDCIADTTALEPEYKH